MADTHEQSYINATIDWKQQLKDRQIYHVALEAGWHYHAIHNGHEHGWAYPIFNLQGQPAGMRWKNMNSAGSPRYFWTESQTDENRFPYYILPGTYEAVREAEGRIYLANGEPALLAYRAAGLLNSFCTLNGEASIPADFLYILKALGVTELVYFYDNDETGQKAAHKVAEKLRGTDIEYCAMHLPGDMPPKADVNDWFIARHGSAQIFQRELIYSLESAEKIFIHQPAHTMPEIPEKPRRRKGKKYDELPRQFYEAIIQTLVEDYGLKSFKGTGFSQNCRCPHHQHEHDDINPAGSWHLYGHFFTCHKCGCTYNAIETGEALGLDWRDFIPEKKRKKSTDKSATEKDTAQISARGQQLLDLKTAQCPTDIVAVDEADYYTTPPPNPDIKDVLNVLKSHSTVYGKLRFLEDHILENLLDRGEQGDGLLFRQMFSDKLIYDHSQKAWYVWQGHYWKRDVKDTVSVYIMEYLSAYFRERSIEYFTRANHARGGADSGYLRDLANRLTKHANQVSQLRYARRINAIAGMYMPLQQEWDSNPMLIGLQNGVVELETGHFRHGHPEDYMRSVSPIHYDPAATAPTFEKFMNDILDNHEKVHFMQRLLGYGITGLNREHILPILYGRGRNGKDTLLNTIRAVMGKMAGPGFGDIMISNGKHSVGRATPEIYDLAGKRIVWATESDATAKLNVHQVKMLTGSETIRARPLYGQPVEFRSSHLLMLSTNHIPEMPSIREDYAIWQRLLMVEFPYSFVENPQTDKERLIDKNLQERLNQELPGVLNWLLAGLMQWHKEGLNPPESVKMATQEAERDRDPIGDFLQEECVEDTDATIPAAKFYDAYLAWARKQNAGKPMTRTKFGRVMTKQYKKTHTVTGKIYAGIRLKQDE